MATVEAPIHDNVKQRLVTSKEQDTVHIFRTLHNTARVAKNKVSEEVVAIERRGGAKFEDIRHLVSGERGRQVYVTGDVDQGTDINFLQIASSRLNHGQGFGVLESVLG